MTRTPTIPSKPAGSPEDLAERYGVSPTVAELAADAARSISRGELAEAIDRLRLATDEAPSFVWAWRSRARCLQFARRFDEAIACYRTSYDLDGQVGDLEGLGSCQRSLGDIDGALETLDRAIELRPRFVDAWYSRSLAHEVAGNNAAALADFDRFLELAGAGASARADHGHQRDAEAHQRLEAHELARRRAGR